MLINPSPHQSPLIGCMTILTRRTLITTGLAGTAALVAGMAVRRSFVRDLAAERARVSHGSTIFQSRYGQAEYAEAGSGPPVIMIHGTGGGFDQGLAFARPLLASGYRVIAPSRFGYLRSAMPPDASSDAQADVIADLMDRLQIARAPVIGGSAGARSAIAFAIRHPTRCSGLVALVPATFVPDRPVPMPGVVGAAIIEHGLRSDFLFWAGITFAPRRMIRTILATDAALFDAASPEERARVLAILGSILPVSARADGLLNDTRLALNPERRKTL